MLRPGTSLKSDDRETGVSKLKRMAVISPAGMVERMVRACRRLGNERSSMYFAAPLALDAPSLRSTLRPTAFVARGMATIIRKGVRSRFQAADDTDDCRPRFCPIIDATPASSLAIGLPSM